MNPTVRPAPRCRRGFAVAGLLAFAGRAAMASAAAADSAPAPAGSAAELLGVWRGTSLCTDRVLAPSCHDEQVIYTFVAAPADSAAPVRLEADKVVGGERQRMGEMDFVYRQATGRWESEFQNARYHGLWSFEVRGRTIAGELVDLPSGGRVRAVRVERDAVP